MRVDPEIIRMAAETVRAEVLGYPPAIKLDGGIVLKIREKVPIFHGMSTEQLLQTLAMAEQYPVAAGEAVFHEGDMGDSFFVVISGEVSIEKSGGGKAVELARLGAGDCFGEMGLVGHRLRSATVRAAVDAVTLRFYREHVDAHSESAFLIYRNIARILASRLDNSSVMLADLVRRAASA